MRHVTVYGQPGIYAGWPANHGSWQWGDEFLVGFIRGRHNVGGMHNVIGHLEKVQARSLDGGESWAVEVPNVDFEAREDQLIYAYPFLLQHDRILRVCGGYDHGGDACAKGGGYYVSNDRGRLWHGPWVMKGLDLPKGFINTSRTCVLDDLVFVSMRNEDHWGSDRTFVARYDGRTFTPLSIVLDDDARAVMPAAARLPSGRIVAMLRRRSSNRLGGWIDAVVSDDNAESWSLPVHVAETGRDNGNPPALIECGGALYCAYANRSECTVEVMRSEDGFRWFGHALLRKGEAHDIGYPRLFERSDGNLVCVYYWAERDDDPAYPQRIEATVFEP